MSDLLNRFIKDLSGLGVESMGRYYSIYRAFVADREDPMNLQRLRLVIPEISAQDVYDYWAFPMGQFSGDKFGIQIIPQKGDLVWVHFERGNPLKPVWSHGYRGELEVPTEADTNDKDCYWFISPAGHTVKINDTKKYIHVKTMGGDYLEINDQSISLVTDKKISLGKLNQSQYKAVLGEPTKELLTTMKDFMDKFQEALNSDLLASVSDPYLKKTNLSTTGPQLKVLAVNMTNQIDAILSGKVTLD